MEILVKSGIHLQFHLMYSNGKAVVSYLHLAIVLYLPVSKFANVCDDSLNLVLFSFAIYLHIKVKL